MIGRRPQKPLAETTLPAIFRDLKNDYAALRKNRLTRQRTGYIATGSHADYHLTEAQFLEFIEMAREADRDDSVVGMMVDRATDNVVQQGFTLDPQTAGDDRELEAELRERWSAWADDPLQCDAAGRATFADIQWINSRATKVDGDMLDLPRDDGKLQMVEGHRLRTPNSTSRNVIHGILLDSVTRRPLEYWFTREDVDLMASLSLVSDVVRYPAFDASGRRLVYHVSNPKRASQTRGITAFAPVFQKLTYLEDIDFAKLVQQQLTSCFALLHTIPDKAKFGPGPRGQKGPQTTETMSDGVARLLEGVAPGLEVFGRPGEVIEGFSPRIPNPEYFEQMRMLLQTIAACLNLPLVSLLLDGKETNFTGWRGAINQAQIGWRREQRALRDQLVLPVWNWKLAEWAASDPALKSRLDAGEITVRVNLPNWPYIQPEIESAADESRRRNIQASPRQIAMDRGRDWQEVAGETVADNAFIIRAAIAEADAIQAETGVPVDPGQLIFLDPARPLTVASPPPDGGGPEDAAGPAAGKTTPTEGQT